MENLQTLEALATANTNSHEFLSFYCRFRLLPEKRSLFQTKIIRLTRLQNSYLFDHKQLFEFELPYEQLANHSLEIFLYKVGTVKPLSKDLRLATVKYDLNELSESEQMRAKKLLEENDSTQARPSLSLSSSLLDHSRTPISVNF